MSDESRDDLRLEHLEGAVRALRDQVDALRAEVAGLRGGSTAASTDARERLAMPAVAPGATAADAGAPPRPQHASGAVGQRHPQPAARTTFAPPSLARVDGATVETLVGRYGTLALATLTILMGVGAFVSWAIANAQLGPTLRVGLGAALALATALLGAWLRRRGTVRFGNVLLGLALAIVHVDAWGAGPNLGLVPPAAALTVAALASAALAALAWASAEQTLFAVGVGGALLAPFVTGGGSSAPAVLLTYGWVVIAAALGALRSRRWPLAARILTLAIATYTTAGMAAAGGGPLVERLAPPLFALACAWTALALATPPHRRTIVRASLIAGVLGLALASLDVGRPSIPPLTIALIAAAITASAWVALYRDDEPAIAWWPADAFLIPIGALAVALLALPQVVSPRGALLAVAWTVAAAAVAAATWLRAPVYRAGHALTAALAGIAAIVLAAHAESTVALLALAAFAVVLGAVQRRTALDVLVGPALLALALPTAWAYDRLLARPPFGYTPFLTTASALALATVVAWWAWARLATAAPAAATDAPVDRAAHRLYAAPAALVALWWGRTELASTGSPELANFLLTLYYAACGVAAILVGRLRAAAAARHVGLALAIFAALRALGVASDLRQVQLRVGSYLLVGAFLLAVAYWYRTAGDSVPDAPPTGPAA